MSSPPLDAPVVLRSMGPEDIHPVHRIEELCFASPWPLSSYRFEVHENKASRSLVAEVEGKDGRPRIVGMIVVWLLIDEAHIANIAVHPEHRRQGIACQMLRAALIMCVQEGAVNAFLEVRPSNRAALGLYEQFGFEPVGRRKRYYQDNQEDAILMTLKSVSLSALAAIRCAPVKAKYDAQP